MKRTYEILALKSIELWLLTMGFQLFRCAYIECIQDYGPHRVFMVGAHVPCGDVVTKQEELYNALTEFIAGINRYLHTVKLQPYDVEFYPGKNGGSIYASVYI